MVPITDEERNGPLYKYFMRDMVEPDPAKYAQTQDPVDFPEEESALHLDNLFDPGYMPVELGYGILANLTEFPGATVEMFDFWFAWHPIEPMRYKIWNRDQHYYCKTMNPEIALNKSLSLRERLSLEFWERIAQKEQPERIFIEFNGMWNLKAFLEQPLPRGWYYSTIFSFVDAMTYALYLKNMRLIIMSPLSVSDVIIFNRCDESFPREDTRRAIKLLNPNAEVFFTRPDGTLETCSDLLLESDKDGLLTISEDTFCRWFVDTIEHTDRYYGKKVHFIGMVTRDLHASGKRFYLGRYVLICCPEDAQFVGFVAELADCDRSYDSGDEISNLSGNTTENLKNITNIEAPLTTLPGVIGDIKTLVVLSITLSPTILLLAIASISPVLGSSIITLE